MNKHLTKSHNHLYFWVNNTELFESYETIRGKRFRKIMNVPGMQNIEKCTEKDIDKIEKLYLDLFNIENRFQFYLQMVKLDPDKISIVQLQEMRRTFFGACGILMELMKNQVSELSEDDAIIKMLDLEKQVSNFFIGQDNNYN